LAWLRLAGIPYEQTVEENPRKGPKGKNPWIELDGERIGDSEIIIDLLTRRYGVNLDEGLTAEQMSLGHAWRRTFEEHFHQVLEWELMLHPVGAVWLRRRLGLQMPSLIASPVFLMLQSHFRLHLYARGIARHAPEVIAEKGRADLNAIAAFLGDRPFLLGERPTFRRYGRVRVARSHGLLADGDAGGVPCEIAGEPSGLLRTNAQTLL